MKCPVCKVPSFVVEYEDVELDLCPECKGVWFDRGELDLLLGGGPAIDTSPASTSEEARRCPVCPQKMDKVNIGPGRRVLIDSCPAGCGLWFDGNELSDLTGDLRSEGWQVKPEVKEFLCGIIRTEDDNQ